MENYFSDIPLLMDDNGGVPEINKNIHATKYKFIKHDYSNVYYVEKKNKKVPLPPIEQIIKNAVIYSRENMLSCFIQYLLENNYEEGNDNIKNQIFDSIKENIYDLSIDFYGNYVIQGILYNNDKAKNKYILNKLIEKDIYKLSLHTYGSRVIQKLIDNSLDYNDKKLIYEKLKNNLKELFLHQNGNHVIQKLIINLDEEDLDDIYNAVFKDIKELIRNIYGSHIIQVLIFRLQNEEKLINLINEIINDNIIELCKDQYSNYVLKIILSKDKKFLDIIFEKIKGNLAELTKNIYALYSIHIIEFIIKYGNDKQKKEICEEIIENDNKDNNYILNLINDNCGNFLIGTIIDFCPLDIIQEIINRIKKNFPKDLKRNWIFIHQKLFMKGINI